MIKCINHSHPEYAKLNQAIPNKGVLDAFVRKHQKDTDTETFPTLGYALDEYKKLATKLPDKFTNDTVNKLLNAMSNMGVDIVSFKDYFGKEYPNERFDVLGVADMLSKTMALSDDADWSTFVEEAAHFIVAALPKNKRFTLVLDQVVGTPHYADNESTYRKFFKSDKRNAHLSDAQIEELVRLEVLGKLVADTFQNANTETIPQKLYNGLKRLMRWFMELITGKSQRALRSFLKSLDEQLRTGSLDVTNQNLGSARFFEIKEELFRVIDAKTEEATFINKFLDKFGNEEVDFNDPDSFIKFRDPLKAKLLEGLQARMKKLRIYQAKGQKGWAEEERDKIERMKDALFQQEITWGYVSFINTAEQDIDQIIKDLHKESVALKDISNRSIAQLSNAAKQAETSAKYATAYKDILEFIALELTKQEALGSEYKDNEGFQMMKNTAKDLLSKMSIIESYHKEIQRAAVAKALYPLAQENPLINSIDDVFELLDEKEGDINYLRSFASSMAESSDDVLGLLDQLMKMYKDKARLESEKYIRQLVNADADLKATGIRNTRWMAEYDDEGNPTGNIISRISWHKYYTARNKMYNDLRKALNLPDEGYRRLLGLGYPPTLQLQEDRKAWLKENRDITIKIKQYNQQAQKSILGPITVGTLIDRAMKRQDLSENEKYDWVMDKIAAHYRRTVSEWFKANKETSTYAIEKKVKKLLKAFLPGFKYTDAQLAEFIRQAHTDHVKIFGQKYATKANEQKRNRDAGLTDEAIRDAFDKALEKYGEWIADNKLESKWTDDVIYTHEASTPKLSIYGNKTFLDMEAGAKRGNVVDKAKMDYYNTYMNIKTLHDAGLPGHSRDPLRMPQVRKDFLERLRQNMTTPKKGAGALGRELSEKFKRLEDDTEFGNNFIMTDENDEPVKLVPIHYTRTLKKFVNKETGQRVSRMRAAREPDKFERKFAHEDISLDFTEALSLYITSAQNYIQTNQVIDLMEAAKDILDRRDITKGEDLLGKVGEYFSYFRGKKARVKKGGETAKRFQSYLNMVGYGEMKKDEGSFMGIDVAKATDAFNMYTAIQGLGFNLYSGVANILHGNALIRQEAWAKEEFSQKDLNFARKTYWSGEDGIIGVIKDVGKPISDSKLRVVGEYLDVLQDFKSRTYELNTSRKRLERLFTTSSLFIINHIGEHQMQYRTALAFLNREKVWLNGEQISVWDAVYVKDGQLHVKEGVTKVQNGSSKYTLEDFAKLGRKIQALNQSLYGVYNEVDRSAMQQYALGRLALVFRKFIVPGIHRRWGKRYYNYERGHEIEGMYMSTGRFFGLLFQELKDSKIAFTSFSGVSKAASDVYKSMSIHAQANIVRTAIEAGYLLALTILGSILLSWSADDDDNNFLAFVAYQTNRLYSELSFNANIKEFIRIGQSPAAGLDVIDTVTRYFKILDITGYLIEGDPLIRRYKAGPNKDKTYLWITTTKLIPLYDNIADWWEADQKLKFYNN
jgi:hypothetical protein